MIELMRIELAGDRALDLSFSDGSSGRWSAEAIIGRDTVLTRPLADCAYSARAFIEAGALAWPNGLEFSAHSLHAKLAEARKPVRKAAQRSGRRPPPARRRRPRAEVASAFMMRDDD